MAIIPQRSVFTWDTVDAASDLDRLRLVLDVLPDEGLMHALEARRGQGRDEYPVRPVWNSILAGVVYQHPSVQALRRELLRNGQLRDLCGFDPLLGVQAVPTASAFSNFLAALMELEPQVRRIVHILVERLRDHLPDLGRFLAVDGKALPSFGRPRKKHQPVRLRRDGQADRRADPDADWGTKTHRGAHEDGTPWEKVTHWFGFELHLLVDSRHEMPINYKVTPASTGESPQLLALVADTQEKHPELIRTAEELAADKGYDSKDNNSRLLDEYAIKPVIDKREDWKSGDDTRPVFPDRVDTVVHDVKGRVSCVCPATGERRPMAPWGYEPDRMTLKYRCPAVAAGFVCQGREQCPGAGSDYGKVVRIPLETDRRMFTPIALRQRQLEARLSLLCSHPNISEDMSGKMYAYLCRIASWRGGETGGEAETNSSHTLAVGGQGGSRGARADA